MGEGEGENGGFYSMPSPDLLLLTRGRARGWCLTAHGRAVEARGRDATGLEARGRRKRACGRGAGVGEARVTTLPGPVEDAQSLFEKRSVRVCCVVSRGAYPPSCSLCVRVAAHASVWVEVEEAARTSSSGRSSALSVRVAPSQRPPYSRQSSGHRHEARARLQGALLLSIELSGS